MKKFLSKLLEHTIYTTVSVIILTVVIGFGNIAHVMWKETIVYHPLGPKIQHFYSHEEISPSFAFTKVTLEENSEILVVTGRLKNISKDIWYKVNLELNYYVEDIKMGSCFYSSRLENLMPNKIYYFSIKCDSLSTKKLPTNFSYKPILESGSKPHVAE